MKMHPRYVSRYKDRHGKVRWIFRKNGKTKGTALTFGKPEWWEWYSAALQGEVREVGAERTIAGTFHALIVAYYASSDWKALRPATQSSRRREVERFRSEHGDRPVRHLEAWHIAVMMDRKADLPGAANNRLKTLRALLAFAKTRGWRSDNPAMEVRKLRYRSDGFHTWSEDEIGKFEARWPVGTRERLAFDLLLYTGQRSADVRVMTAGQLRAGYISLRQSKTDGVLEIPIHPCDLAGGQGRRSPSPGHNQVRQAAQREGVQQLDFRRREDGRHPWMQRSRASEVGGAAAGGSGLHSS